MCGKRLKIFLLSLVLVLPLSVSPCFSKVVLTDEEAKEIMSELENAKKELQTLKQQSQTELENAKTASTEQRKSYEERLNEANKEIKKFQMWTAINGSLAVTLSLVLLFFLL